VTASSSNIDLHFRPKKYFPREKEVVIAEIIIKSTLSDVTWVRARQTKDRIRYAVIDEYAGETLTGKNTRSSKLPLTLGELADFFLGAWNLFSVLRINFAHQGYPPEKVRAFFHARSRFYPDFGKLVEQRVEEWLQQQRGRSGIA
jgi:hypothetical protein